MSNTFEYCFLIPGTDYVRFERRPDRPLDPMPDGAVLKGRNIVRVREQTGTTDDPESGEQVPVYSVLEDKYHKWNGSELEAMTGEERASRDAYDTAQAEAAEAARQASKPDGLKEVENNFYALIFAIFGDYEKRGFDEIQAAIEAIKQTDFNTATELGLKLLAIDAAGKRYGQMWWDDAVVHE